MNGDDPHDLQRFVDAQRPVWDTVTAELQAGAKRTHWMWFVFPQHVALGRSATARRYGIAGLAEAEAYAAHPLLGPRLLQCCGWLLALPGRRSALEVMGTPDDVKLRSSMTLFERTAPHQAASGRVLERYFAGERDAETLRLLGQTSSV